MHKRHDFNVLTMELRLLCIKPPKLYVNSSRIRELIGKGGVIKVKPNEENKIIVCFLKVQHFLKW